MTTTQDPPVKKPPRVVVTFRMAATGKAAMIEYAKKVCGYRDYTAWVRDLVAAEIRNPKHNLRAQPKEKR